MGTEKRVRDNGPVLRARQTNCRVGSLRTRRSDKILPAFRLLRGAGLIHGCPVCMNKNTSNFFYHIKESVTYEKLNKINGRLIEFGRKLP